MNGLGPCRRFQSIAEAHPTILYVGSRLSADLQISGLLPLNV
jgi:hypothetical protein